MIRNLIAKKKIYINDISFIQRTVFSHPLVQHLGAHPVAKCSHIANSRKSPSVVV